jgi:hypothetical protein
MKWYLKATLIVLAVLVVVFAVCNPEAVRSWLRSFDDWVSGRSPSNETPELSEAELRGRIRAARQYALEVQSRLDAYKARFDCPATELLDRAFLDPESPLALHRLRKDWYAIRRELPEFLEKHRSYQDFLQRAETEIMDNPTKVKEYWTLPERANVWSRSLADTIAQRTRKLPTFTILAQQVAAQQNAQQRRKP